MTLLAALLALNAVLHGVVVGRFGLAGTAPFAVFGVIYAALAAAVLLAAPYVLWAVLGLAVIGIIGLTVTFHAVDRDKSLDRVIWGLDAATIGLAAWLVFGGGA